MATTNTTSNQEFDYERRVWLTNELPNKDLSKSIHNALRNEFWLWLLGWQKVSYDETVFEKTVNGIEAPVYGPKPEFLYSKKAINAAGAINYIQVKSQPKYHKIDLNGVLITELDLLMHEFYRYLGHLYPDHPEYLEILTKNELNDELRQAALIIDYEPDLDLFEILQNLSSGDLDEKEAVKSKIRDLWAHAFRRKFYGTNFGFKMMAASLGYWGEIYQVMNYLPLKEVDKLLIEDPQGDLQLIAPPYTKYRYDLPDKNFNEKQSNEFYENSKLDLFDSLYLEKFRLLDYTGKISKPIVKKEELTWYLHLLTIPGMDFCLFEVPSSNFGFSKLSTIPEASVVNLLDETTGKYTEFSILEKINSSVRYRTTFNENLNDLEKIPSLTISNYSTTLKKVPIKWASLYKYEAIEDILKNVDLTTWNTFLTNYYLQENLNFELTPTFNNYFLTLYSGLKAIGLFSNPIIQKALWDPSVEGRLILPLTDILQIYQERFELSPNYSSLGDFLGPKYQEDEKVAQTPIPLGTVLGTADVLTTSIDSNLYIISNYYKGEIEVEFNYNIPLKAFDKTFITCGIIIEDYNISKRIWLQGKLVQISSNKATFQIKAIPETLNDEETQFMYPVTIPFFEEIKEKEKILNASASTNETKVLAQARIDELIAQILPYRKNKEYIYDSTTDGSNFGKGSVVKAIYRAQYNAKSLKFIWENVTVDEGNVISMHFGGIDVVTLLEQGLFQNKVLNDNFETLVPYLYSPQPTNNSFKKIWNVKISQTYLDRFNLIEDKFHDYTFPVASKELTKFASVKALPQENFTIVEKTKIKISLHVKASNTGPVGDYINKALLEPMSTNDYTLIQSISIGSKVIGKGIENDSFIIAITENGELILNNPPSMKGETFVEVLSDINLQPSNTDVDFKIKENLILKDLYNGSVSAWETGLYPSTLWNRGSGVSKVKIRSIPDVFFYKPFNEMTFLEVASVVYDKKQRTNTDLKYIVDDANNMRAIKTKYLLPSAIVNKKEAYAEILLDKLIYSPTKIGNKPALMVSQLLNQLEKTKKEWGKSCENVNVGVQLTLETDTSGKITQSPGQAYTNVDIKAKFQTIRWKDDTIPIAVQLGNGGVQDDLDSLLQQSDIDFATLWGSAFYNNYITPPEQLSFIQSGGILRKRFLWGPDDKIFEKKEDTVVLKKINKPLYTIPLGEHNITYKYRPENDEISSTIINFSTQKKDLSLKKKLGKNFVIESSSYLSDKGILFSVDDKILEHKGEFIPTNKQPIPETTQAEVANWNKKGIIPYWIVYDSGSFKDSTTNYVYSKNSIIMFVKGNWKIIEFELGSIINPTIKTYADFSPANEEIVWKDIAFNWGGPYLTDDSGVNLIYTEQNFTYDLWHGNPTHNPEKPNLDRNKGYVIITIPSSGFSFNNFSIIQPGSYYVVISISETEFYIFRLSNFRFFVDTIVYKKPLNLDSFAYQNFIGYLRLWAGIVPTERLTKKTFTFQLPNENITPGTLNVKLRVNTEFIGQGWVLTLKDEDRNIWEKAKTLDYIDITYGPIYKDLNLDEFYMETYLYVWDEEVKIYKKKYSGDQDILYRVAIKFDEPTYFKNLLYITGQVSEKQGRDENGNFVVQNEVKYINGLPFRLDLVSTDDKLLSYKPIEVRSPAIPALEGKAFNSYLPVNLDIQGINTSTKKVYLGVEVGDNYFVRKVKNRPGLNKIIPKNSSSAYSTFLIPAQIIQPKVGIALTTSLSGNQAQNDEANIALNFHYYKNLLVFRANVPASSPNLLLPSDQNLWNQIVSILKNNDKLIAKATNTTFDEVWRKANIYKSGPYGMQLLNGVNKLKIFDNLIVAAIQGGEIAVLENPDFNAPQVVFEAINLPSPTGSNTFIAEVTDIFSDGFNIYAIAKAPYDSVSFRIYKSTFTNPKSWVEAFNVRVDTQYDDPNNPVVEEEASFKIEYPSIPNYLIAQQATLKRPLNRFFAASSMKEVIYGVEDYLAIRPASESLVDHPRYIVGKFPKGFTYTYEYYTTVGNLTEVGNYFKTVVGVNRQRVVELKATAAIRDTIGDYTSEQEDLEENLEIANNENSETDLVIMMADGQLPQVQNEITALQAALTQAQTELTSAGAVLTSEISNAASYQDGSGNLIYTNGANKADEIKTAAEILKSDIDSLMPTYNTWQKDIQKLNRLSSQYNRIASSFNTQSILKNYAQIRLDRAIATGISWQITAAQDTYNLIADEYTRIELRRDSISSSFTSAQSDLTASLAAYQAATTTKNTSQQTLNNLTYQFQVIYGQGQAPQALAEALQNYLDIINPPGEDGYAQYKLNVEDAIITKEDLEVQKIEAQSDKTYTTVTAIPSIQNTINSYKATIQAIYTATGNILDTVSASNLNITLLNQIENILRTDGQIVRYADYNNWKADLLANGKIELNNFQIVTFNDKKYTVLGETLPNNLKQTYTLGYFTDGTSDEIELWYQFLVDITELIMYSAESIQIYEKINKVELMNNKAFFISEHGQLMTLPLNNVKAKTNVNDLGLEDKELWTVANFFAERTVKDTNIYKNDGTITVKEGDRLVGTAVFAADNNEEDLKVYQSQDNIPTLQATAPTVKLMTASLPYNQHTFKINKLMNFGQNVIVVGEWLTKTETEDKIKTYEWEELDIDYYEYNQSDVKQPFIAVSEDNGDNFFVIDIKALFPNCNLTNLEFRDGKVWAYGRDLSEQGLPQALTSTYKNLKEWKIEDIPIRNGLVGLEQDLYDALSGLTTKAGNLEALFSGGSTALFATSSPLNPNTLTIQSVNENNLVLNETITPEGTIVKQDFDVLVAFETAENISTPEAYLNSGDVIDYIKPTGGLRVPVIKEVFDKAKANKLYSYREQLPADLRAVDSSGYPAFEEDVDKVFYKYNVGQDENGLTYEPVVALNQFQEEIALCDIDGNQLFKENNSILTLPLIDMVTQGLSSSNMKIAAIEPKHTTVAAAAASGLSKEDTELSTTIKSDYPQMIDVDVQDAKSTLQLLSETFLNRVVQKDLLYLWEEKDTWEEKLKLALEWDDTLEDLQSININGKNYVFDNRRGFFPVKSGLKFSSLVKVFHEVKDKPVEENAPELRFKDFEKTSEQISTFMTSSVYFPKNGYGGAIGNISDTFPWDIDPIAFKNKIALNNIGEVITLANEKGAPIISPKGSKVLSLIADEKKDVIIDWSVVTPNSFTTLEVMDLNEGWTQSINLYRKPFPIIKLDVKEKALVFFSDMSGQTPDLTYPNNGTFEFDILEDGQVVSNLTTYSYEVNVLDNKVILQHEFTANNKLKLRVFDWNISLSPNGANNISDSSLIEVKIKKQIGQQFVEKTEQLRVIKVYVENPALIPQPTTVPFSPGGLDSFKIYLENFQVFEEDVVYTLKYDERFIQNLTVVNGEILSTNIDINTSGARVSYYTFTKIKLSLSEIANGLKLTYSIFGGNGVTAQQATHQLIDLLEQSIPIFIPQEATWNIFFNKQNFFPNEREAKVYIVKDGVEVSTGFTLTCNKGTLTLPTWECPQEESGTVVFLLEYTEHGKIKEKEFKLNYFYDDNTLITSQKALRIYKENNDALLNFIVEEESINVNIELPLKVAFGIGINTLINGVKNGFIPLRTPKYPTFKELVEAEGSYIENALTTEIPITDNKIKQIKMTGNLFILEKDLTELPNGKAARFKILTKSSVLPTTEQAQDPAYFKQLTTDEVKTYSYDRIYFPDNYPQPPTIVGGTLFYKENVDNYKKTTLMNANGDRVFQCDENGHYIYQYNNDGKLISEIYNPNDNTTKRVNPLAPLYDSAKEWFENEFYLDSDPGNPFWHFVTIQEKWSTEKSRFIQHLKVERQVKTSSSKLQLTPIEKGKNFIVVSKSIYLERFQDMYVIDIGSNYINKEYGWLTLLLGQPDEYYKNQKYISYVGITAFNTAPTFDLFGIGNHAYNTEIEFEYSVQTRKNYGNLLDKEASVVEINELGLVDQRGNLCCYASFPPIEYDSDKQHISFNLFIRHGKLMPF
jgi:hypothetical protein